MQALMYLVDVDMMYVLCIPTIYTKKEFNLPACMIYIHCEIIRLHYVFIKDA